jgi:hypothetical protein
LFHSSIDDNGVLPYFKEDGVTTVYQILLLVWLSAATVCGDPIDCITSRPADILALNVEGALRSHQRICLEYWSEDHKKPNSDIGYTSGDAGKYQHSHDDGGSFQGNSKEV